MKRYFFSACGLSGEKAQLIIGEDPQAEWVKYSDVQHLEQRIGRLREALAEAEGFVNRHSEDWYTSGQRLLTEIRAALKESE